MTSPTPPISESNICQVQTLASGSKGNVIFVRMGETRVLIDVGISRRRIVKGLQEIGEDPNDLDAIILTHEHSDHIASLRLAYQTWPHVPIYSTRGTANACIRRKKWDFEYKTMKAGVVFHVGPVEVSPFATSHDAAESVGVRLSTHDFAVGVATDLGRFSNTVERALKDCQVLVLEANHDEEMLWRGPYPLHLKRRVVSNLGHLSNRQCRDLIGRVAGPRLERVILGHLSDKNNTPGLALDALGSCLDKSPKAEVIVAPQKEATPLYTFLPSEATLATHKPMPSPDQWQQGVMSFLEQLREEAIKSMS